MINTLTLFDVALSISGVALAVWLSAWGFWRWE